MRNKSNNGTRPTGNGTRATGIKGAVYTAFSESPGKDVFVADLVQDTKFSRDQVLSAIANLKSNMRDRGLGQIVPIVSGSVYRFVPSQFGDASQPAEPAGPEVASLEDLLLPVLKAKAGKPVWFSEFQAALPDYEFTKADAIAAMDNLSAEEHPDGRIEHLEPSGNRWRWQPKQASVPYVPAPRADMAAGQIPNHTVQVKVMATWADGTMALDINGQPYIAKPA